MILDVSPSSLGNQVWIFLKGKGMNKFASKFSTDSFLMALAKLNGLNFQLQGKDKRLPHLADKAGSFTQILETWAKKYGFI